MNEATIAKKHEEVQVIREKISKAGSTLFVDYLGLTVAEVNEICVKLRRATKEEGFDGVEEHLVGPSAIVVGNDEVTAAKVVYDFAKDHEKLSVKVGIVDNKVTSEADLKSLSKLPNKEGMLSMLLSVLQAPIRNLACVVKAVSEKEN